MIFTIFIGLLFIAIVFFHYLQGFFSSAISAILAVLAAVLAFSWHEVLVEKLLQGKVANIAHSMVLVVLFAAIYIIFRAIFDKAIPEGVSLPAAIDRVGGAIMGIVAASFALGILAIAAQELPLGPAVAGYTKYDTQDSPIQIANGTGQSQTGYNNDELHSSVAGHFAEDERKQLFPLFPAGVDEIVVKTVDHLSSTGSMQGSQPLTAVHPDFLPELYGERAGIQGGAQHVTLNLPSQPPAIQIDGIFTLSKVRMVDSEYSGIRHGAVATPLKLEKSFDMSIGKVGGNDIPERVQYAEVTKDKDGSEMALIVVRITFGLDAADSDRVIRLSAGSIRLVANRPGKDGQPYNYYPIGTLEPGRPYPMFFADKPDDPIFVASDSTGATRPGIDAVFAVDKAGVLEDVQAKKLRIVDGTFIEVKRMFREDLGGKDVAKWSKAVGIGSIHQAQGPAPRDKWHPDVVGAGLEPVPEPAKTEGSTPTPTPPPADPAADAKKKAIEAADLTTAEHLKLIHAAIMKDAQDHGAFLTTDLERLVGPSLKPEIFLQGGSATAVPTAIMAQDLKHQSDWVNQNTDFVYLGSGKSQIEAAGLFVLAYTKPGGIHTSFLRSDGTVSVLDAAQSTKIIAELKAGKNPAPSLKQ